MSILINSPSQLMFSLLETIDSVNAKARQANYPRGEVEAIIMRTQFYRKFAKAVESRPSITYPGQRATVSDWEKVFNCRVSQNNRIEPEWIMYDFDNHIVGLPLEFTRDRGFTDEDWRQAYYNGDLSKRARATDETPSVEPIRIETIREKKEGE